MTDTRRTIDREAALRGIRHWQKEMADTRAQIESGKHPEHDASCRTYIKECSAFVQKLMRDGGIEA